MKIIPSEHYETQNQHKIKIICALAEKLLPLRLEGTEGLSQSFCYELYCLTLCDTAELASYQDKYIFCEIGDKETGLPSRYVNGVITEIKYYTETDNQHFCILTLKPECSLTGLSKKTRVWTERTTTDIISEIFKAHNLHTPEIKVLAHQLCKEFRLQYRESDLSFIHRLLSTSGISYYYKHYKNKHVMVLTDSQLSCSSAQNNNFSLLCDKNINNPNNFDQFFTISNSVCQRTSLSGYNMENTTHVVETSATSVNHSGDIKVSCDDITPEHSRDNIQLLVNSITRNNDFSGKFCQGRTAAWWLNCGEKIYLNNIAKAPKEILIVDIRLVVYNNYNLNQRNDEIICHIDGVECGQNDLLPLPDMQPVFIPGVLLAKVTGLENGEIYTDAYGRIKVIFLFGDDSLPDKEQTSCWLRLSQLWSFPGGGAQFIPRCGSEVLVSFLQGEPDYPVVVGTVYNGKNKPLYTLPENKNMSGILSRTVESSSSKGHELCFDDTNNSEKIKIYSSGDYHLIVEKNTYVENRDEAFLNIGSGRQTEIKKGDDVLLLKDGNLQKKINGDFFVNVSAGDYELDVSEGSGKLTTKGKLSFESLQEITLKVGSNTITLSSSGVTITGVSVKVESTSSAEIKASNIRIEGGAVTELKSSMLNMQGTAMVQIKGGIINIG